MKPIFLYYFLLFLFLSCGGDKKKESIAHLVAEWQGKEIVFPAKPIFTRYLTDTTDYEIPNSEYKIVIYVDSFGCTPCKLQLPGWKAFIAYTDSVTHSKIPFLFFLHPKNYKEVRYLLKENEFELPICIDREDEFNKLNHFPLNRTFQTFLLDKDNRIVMVGNPVHNLAIKELYLKRITCLNSNTNRINTSATVDVKEVNMGMFEKSTTKQALFSLKNTGNKPLVILDIAVSCSCAKVKFDKHSANPGECLQVIVDMTPVESGPFEETITVKCNISEFLILTIKGKSL